MDFSGFHVVGMGSAFAGASIGSYMELAKTKHGSEGKGVN
jgi:hypothetical protein